VRQAVGSWKDVSSERQKEELIKTLIARDTSGVRPRLAVPTGEGMIFINIDEVLYCKASSNYTELMLLDSSIIIVCRTLKEYEQILTSIGFFRIHHTYLVNLALVKKFVRREGYVLMQNNIVLYVSKRKREAFLAKIESDFFSISEK
jgi:two-component system, LytTR family, response regulator